jgi:hypothetical protein
MVLLRNGTYIKVVFVKGAQDLIGDYLSESSNKSVCKLLASLAEAIRRQQLNIIVLK